jgi:hypothetical protein
MIWVKSNRSFVRFHDKSKYGKADIRSVAKYILNIQSCFARSDSASILTFLLSAVSEVGVG